MRRHVYYYTHLSQPYAVAGAALAGDPGLWLPSPARAVDGHWLVDVYADGALPARLACHRAVVDIGPPGAMGDETLRSITWRSANADRAIPVLEGDLELAPLAGDGCHLSLMGSYRPPLAVVGEAGDRLLGRRVAEACVRRLVLDIADRLTVEALTA